MAQPISVLPDGTVLWDDGSTSWQDPSTIPRAQSAGVPTPPDSSGVTQLSDGRVRLPSGAIVDPSAGGTQQLSNSDFAALNQWEYGNNGAASNAAAYPTTDASLLNRQSTNITNLGTQNQGIFNNLSGLQGTFFNAQNALGQQNQGLAQQSADAASQLAAINAGLSGQSWNSATQTNAANNATLGNYLGQVGGINNFQLGNFNNFASALNSQPILQAGGYGAPVVSQAATAHADPASIAMQNQVMSELGGWASGAHALTSQAATAQANPQDIANQQMAANALQAAANGSKDVNFYALPGIGELHNAAQGSKDVHVGQEDPTAYAAELEALKKYQGLTTPQVTAAEQFIYEQARQQQEQDERAQRAAVMSNLRMRGMSGSGQEVVSSALAGQQTSENRLLSDLGAQSNAIARAMAALGGQADLSSAMTNQANQIALANQATQMSALGEYTGIGADVAQNNMNRQLAAQEAASQAYATLRAQGFSEDYARKAAADQMAQFNNSQELQATGMQGDLATSMRTQSFNEDFQTKSAADSVAMFNKEQSQISQRWQEQYAAQQQQAFTDRQTAIMNGSTQTSQILSNNANNAWQAGFTTNQGNNANIQGSLGLQGTLANNTTNARQTGINTQMGANIAQSGTYAQQLAAMTQLGLGQIGNNTSMTQLQNQQLGTQLGYNQGVAAANAAKPPSHTFGLGSDPNQVRGLLGGYVIPGLV